MFKILRELEMKQVFLPDMIALPCNANIAKHIIRKRLQTKYT